MSLYPSDKPAAFMGLIGGAILVFAMCYGIVQWTNARFEGHVPGRANAGAHGAAPASH